MAEIGIFVGTVYGNALLVAEEAQTLLLDLGHQVSLYEDPKISDWHQYLDKVVLIITSTTGQGDLPDCIAALFRDIKDKLGHQPHLRYGLIALGDSSYDHFCGGGKQFDTLLQDQGAQRLGEVLTVDASEYQEPEAISQPWVASWSAML